MVTGSRTIILFFVFLAFLAPLEANCQPADSIAVWRSFYPLSDGDWWEYNQNKPRTVVGDTLMAMANQKVYKKVIEGDCTAGCRTYFQRVDTVLWGVFQYDPNPAYLYDENLIALLPNGEESRQLEYGVVRNDFDIQCGWHPNQEVLGQSRRIWGCGGDKGLQEPYEGIQIRMAERIGPQYMADLGDGGPYNVRIVNYVRNSYLESGIQVSTEHLPHSAITNLSVYPNPARPGSKLNIEGPNLETCSKATFIDILGRTANILTDASSGDRVTFRITNNVQSGSYFGLLRCRSTTMPFNFVVVTN